MIPLVSAPVRKPAVLRRALRPLFTRDPAFLDPVMARFTLDGDWQRDRVRTIGRSFLVGYNAAATAESLAEVHTAVSEVPRFYRPFAYEGAGMGFGPWSYLHGVALPEFADHLDELTPATLYQNYVGLGWWLGMVAARRPRAIAACTARLDHRYRLLPYEGLGFRVGFLNAGSRARTAAFARHGEDGSHVCHQGFGRSLWFVHMGDIGQALTTIQRLGTDHRGDCVSGLGLGCAYSWLDAPHGFDTVLAQVPAELRPDFAQGAAFGWEARQLADRPLFDEQLAAAGPEHRRRVLDAVRVVHEVRDDLVRRDQREAFYQHWRHGTRARVGQLIS
ncbi:DUF1702 family protein [Lentzea kentuckyensis]|uniref:DUF1702 family protein n=1 Tax=Lentzea kentuckyensis TaxID=360086 RepID=UPI000A362A52|nr:DUF1702 family protein [Lentzea kentuckyensis]